MRESRRGEWRWRKARGRQRGCLIYWFNSCQCLSLCLSVRRANGAYSQKHSDQITFSLKFSLSLAVSPASVCLSLTSSLTLHHSSYISLLHFPKFLSLTWWLIPPILHMELLKMQIEGIGWFVACQMHNISYRQFEFCIVICKSIE